jgi:hypothetical protein
MVDTPRKTFPELQALSAPVVDSDVLAVYRSPGPAKRTTATIFADYIKAFFSAATGGTLVGNQLTAGANLRTQTYSDYVEGGELMPSMFTGTNAARLQASITEGGTSRNGALGQATLLPRGVTVVTTQFNMDNRSMLKGVNKRGSIIQADAAHTGPSMIEVINGVTSTFDNRIEELNLDCNDVASLSGVISSAWQEGGGIRDCLINKFRGYGLDIVQTYGGVSQLLIENSEFFGSASGALACIRFNDPSISSSCILMMSNLAVTGGATPAADTDPARATARASMPAAIDILQGSSTSIGVHVEVAERGFRLDGNGRHIIIGAKGSAPNGIVNAGVETLVEIAATFTGTLTMIGCTRNGAINLIKDLRSGGVGTISTDQDYFHIEAIPSISPGQIYAYGTYDGSTVGSPSVALCKGVSSITRNSAGNWTITLTRSLVSADQMVPFGVCVNINGVEPPKVSKIGVNSFLIELRTLGGTPIDANEVKFAVMRL